MRTYSSGMRARLGFAFSSSIRPDILVVDEALSVGDRKFSKKCKDRVHGIMAKESVTVLFVTHSTAMAKEFCTQGIVIRKGHAEFSGEIEEGCPITRRCNKRNDAYMRYHREDPDSVLIIVGGHGNDYQKICERVHELDDLRIILIRNLSNPLNIVAKSDVFVLSSSYEGLPMSIMEALILHKPVVSTSITGPKEFLEQGYGYLVDDSEEGLYEGMCAYKQGLLDSLKPFDAEKFNEKVLREFENLIE